MNRPGALSSDRSQQQANIFSSSLREGSTQPPTPLTSLTQHPRSSNINLFIRQEPLLCKVTIPREKGKTRENSWKRKSVLREINLRKVGGLYERKIINPPPIVQIVIEDNDTSQLWLTERYFFMISTLYEPTTDAVVQAADPPIVGSNVSSLQKVQENNRDIGLFVFGDISVKLEGQFRLKFDLFEYIGLQVVYLKSILSDIFTVYSAKQYPGSLPSTALSRLISDQGIRLRLRKEPNRNKRKSQEAAGPSGVQSQHLAQQPPPPAPPQEPAAAYQQPLVGYYGGPPQSALLPPPPPQQEYRFPPRAPAYGPQQPPAPAPQYYTHPASTYYSQHQRTPPTQPALQTPPAAAAADDPARRRRRGRLGGPAARSTGLSQDLSASLLFASPARRPSATSYASTPGAAYGYSPGGPLPGSAPAGAAPAGATPGAGAGLLPSNPLPPLGPRWTGDVAESPVELRRRQTVSGGASSISGGGDARGHRRRSSAVLGSLRAHPYDAGPDAGSPGLRRPLRRPLGMPALRPALVFGADADAGASPSGGGIRLPPLQLGASAGGGARGPVLPPLGPRVVDVTPGPGGSRRGSSSGESEGGLRRRERRRGSGGGSPARDRSASPSSRFFMGHRGRERGRGGEPEAPREAPREGFQGVPRSAPPGDPPGDAQGGHLTPPMRRVTRSQTRRNPRGVEGTEEKSSADETPESARRGLEAASSSPS